MAPVSKKSNTFQKTGRGGAREGAGRKPLNAETKTLSLLKKSLTPTAFAAYEASQRTPTSRSWIYMPTVNPRYELTGYDRTELSRRGRWFYNNVGSVARAVDGVARYSSPLFPMAETADKKWNKATDQAFRDRCCTSAFGVDLGAEVNFLDAQPFALRHVILDGDFFWQKALSKIGSGMFRFIGAENIGSTSSISSITDGDGWEDGCRVDRFNRPTHWAIMDLEDSSNPKIVKASDLHQIKKHYRRGYRRAPSWLARASNHLQDISEITAYAKESVKLNSQIAFVITSAEAGSVGLGSKRTTQPLGAGVGSITTDMLFNGSGVPQLKPNEKIESFRSEHPNNTFEPFLSFLMRDVAWSMGIAPEVLFAMVNMGSASVRFVLEDANFFFKEIQGIIREQFCRPFYTFWLWSEIEAGRISHPGNDWWRVNFVAPKSPSIDLAKDGQLYMKMVQSGMMSRKRYFSMMGWNPEDEMQSIVDGVLDMKELCAEAGLKMSEVIAPLPGTPVPAGGAYEGEDPDELPAPAKGE